MSVSPVVAQESWDFGDHQKAFISSIPQRPLRVRMHPGTSLRSLKFVTKVGGVAFQATATADESIAYKSIHIFYNEDNDDGPRLGIVIDRDTTYERIPDWQLIPIVEYANSSYNSCVSWLDQSQTTWLTTSFTIRLLKILCWASGCYRLTWLCWMCGPIINYRG